MLQASLEETSLNALNPLWQELKAHAQYCAHHLNLSQALHNSNRFTELSLRAPHMLVDFSKCLWNETTVQHLLLQAEHAGVVQRRNALYAGKVVNCTENRPALHVMLRQHKRKQATCPFIKTNQALNECHESVRSMLDLAQQLRTKGQFTDVVHIGIGGSGLGPEMVLQSLQPWQNGGPRVHVVSNMDGHDLQQVLRDLNPARTLFVVASKSWSTSETLRNMATARAWLSAQPGVDWRLHFVAITSREQAACNSGFTQTLHIPEGVGGRFSVWSAVGLPIALAVGPEVFERMLAGAADMDTHFATAPLAQNLPVWMGMLDVWNSSFLQMPGRCVAPYHHGLRRLPAYLQQLEMESNGKRVCAQGVPLDYHTTGMIWGEPGTNGQHAFFQWLHQGTQRIPVEFIVARKAAHDYPEHQEALLANALAQAQALMQGATACEGQLSGHQDFPGNRPSTFILLDALTPESLGALLALHEHRVLVAGTVWGINSFDQWGVELGKTLAQDIRARMDSGDMEGLDASTAGLLSACLPETALET